MIVKNLFAKTIPLTFISSNINNKQLPLISPFSYQFSYPFPSTPTFKYQFSTSKQSQQPKSKKSSQTNSHYFDEKSSYFEILGVQSNATEQEIKTAYLEMVKKYHPDLSKQSNASEKFQLIQKAFQELSDPQKRGKHREDMKIPDPEQYDKANQFKNKFKNVKRKDSVPDEWHFTYNLFKKHYEEVDAKQKEYQRFEGQGDPYYMHKSELKPTKKVYVQQIGMVVGSIVIVTGALYLTTEGLMN